MRTFPLLALALTATLAYAQYAPLRSGDTFMAKNNNQSNNAAAQTATIKTSKGDMVVEFWTDVAPNTVANFQKLAEKGFYNGTAFHRIVKGFMIQGGDPLTKDLANKDMFGTGGPGYQINAEFNDRSHQLGVLSMARSANPNSAGSQFFICLGDASFLDRQYTAFGQVTSGIDVLKAIGNVPTQQSNSGEKSDPLERIEVLSVTVNAPVAAK